MTGNKAMFITVFLEVRLTDDRIDLVQRGGGGLQSSPSLCFQYSDINLQ